MLTDTATQVSSRDRARLRLSAFNQRTRRNGEALWPAFRPTSPRDQRTGNGVTRSASRFRRSRSPASARREQKRWLLQPYMQIRIPVMSFGRPRAAWRLSRCPVASGGHLCMVRSRRAFRNGSAAMFRGMPEIRIESHSDIGRKFSRHQFHHVYRTPAAPRTPSRLPPSVLPTASW